MRTGLNAHQQYRHRFMIKLFVLTAFGSPLFNAQPKSNRIKLFLYFWLFNMFLVLRPVLCLFRVKKRSLKVERNKQQNQDSLSRRTPHTRNTINHCFLLTLFLFFFCTTHCLVLISNHQFCLGILFSCCFQLCYRSED